MGSKEWLWKQKSPLVGDCTGSLSPHTSPSFLETSTFIQMETRPQFNAKMNDRGCLQTMTRNVGTGTLLNSG